MDQKHQYQQRRARESVNTLFELSQLLNTGLDKRTLALCVSLCEQGVNPEVVARVIEFLRSEKRDGE
ncbi:Conserved hypothetical protein [Geotrichum candidum]|uniref:Mitotic-spindle organizing protein 1 n=1 Tax=Geotrichum candidum TaxID=1173061 RepID=A0A0J9XFT9_GEOCN|nr:Conserved hypothetical protein [Geotrichum candidum]